MKNANIIITVFDRNSNLLRVTMFLYWMYLIPFFWEDFIRIGEVNVRSRRYRYNFHSFALSDKEEDILKESKKITGQGLTDTLMSALEEYVKNNTPQEKEDKSKSHLELLEEFFFPNKKWFQEEGTSSDLEQFIKDSYGWWNLR